MGRHKLLAAKMKFHIFLTIESQACVIIKGSKCSFSLLISAKLVSVPQDYNIYPDNMHNMTLYADNEDKRYIAIRLEYYDIAGPHVMCEE